jgi:hypothetical protein
MLNTFFIVYFLLILILVTNYNIMLHCIVCAQHFCVLILCLTQVDLITKTLIFCFFCLFVF